MTRVRFWYHLVAALDGHYGQRVRDHLLVRYVMSGLTHLNRPGHRLTADSLAHVGTPPKAASSADPRTSAEDRNRRRRR